MVELTGLPSETTAEPQVTGNFLPMFGLALMSS